MSASYGQFCPIAKASEIFATRWTPLIVREVMSGVHSFNDIHPFYEFSFSMQRQIRNIQ
jgi:DNA-binding HxlR family transcriptional regulator